MSTIGPRSTADGGGPALDAEDAEILCPALNIPEAIQICLENRESEGWSPAPDLAAAYAAGVGA